MTEPNHTGREARTDTDESETNKVDWDAIGYITASNYRIQTIRALNDQPATPSQIADKIDEEIPQISRALNNLRDRGFVELLVCESRQKGRYYGLTDKGETILNSLPQSTTPDEDAEGDA